MNFIFISPQFPHTYWNFCSRLKRNGVNVLAIGDTPYDALSSQLKESITEYYRVNNMESYDEMYRAVAFFAFDIIPLSPTVAFKLTPARISITTIDIIFSYDDVFLSLIVFFILFFKIFY